jgi:hypothetical protein
MAEVADVGTKSSINGNENTSRRWRNHAGGEDMVTLSNGGGIHQPWKRRNQSAVVTAAGSEGVDAQQR